MNSSSKRNSVSPPNWEQQSEEDQPLDFSRASSDDSADSKTSNGKSSNKVTSTQSPESTNAASRMFLPATSPRQNSSPQTLSPDISDAEPSDGVTKIPSPMMFARGSLPPTLSPSGLHPGHDLLNPALSQLYQLRYPGAMPQIDAALLHGTQPYLEPEYLIFRQQQAYLTQKLQQLQGGRRKHVIPSPSVTPNPIKSPEISSELSEHSNDSQHISTSNQTPGSGTPTKSQMAGRRRGKAYPEEMKDDAYWERRRKNNEAAKRSRDARRMKEDETAIRAAFLEEENMKLKTRNALLEAELAKFRCIFYSPAE